MAFLGQYVSYSTLQGASSRYGAEPRAIHSTPEEANSRYGIVVRARSAASSSPLFGTKRTDELAIPIITHSILAMLDGPSWQALPFVNKGWYKAVQGKTFLYRFSHDEHIAGGKDRYTIKRTIIREEAQVILRQTGIEIAFELGQERVDNHRLGRGCFGEFCIGYAVQKAHFVGIKITRGAAASVKEANLQKALSGLPYIIPTIDVCKAVDTSGNKTLYQVMELAGLGSAAKLKSQLERITDPQFKEQILFCLARGLLAGLSQMHQRGFYHLDIKPDNLVVRQDGRIFIIDFGCSTYSKNGQITAAQEDGDQCYFSPERFLAYYKGVPEQCAADKIDAWAAGLTLLDLLTNSEGLPYADMQAIMGSHEPYEQTRRAITEYMQKHLALAEASPDSIWSLVQGLLVMEPERRLSPGQALNHPWVVRMEKDAPTWQSVTLDYVREMVQAAQRETRQSKAVDFSPLSPQDLPLPHFASFVERTQLQQMFLKSMLVGGRYEQRALLACQGMGGVGKTQLMTYLLYHPKVQNHFGLKLWFRSCDNKNILETQFLFLARELGIVETHTPQQQALQELRSYLELYFKRFGKPWLAIFDNAEDPQLLEPYLPRCGGQIVVTARSDRWKDAIAVDVFTPEEGAALVRKLLLRDDSHAAALCKELGYLPLGLIQACAYIRNQMISVPTFLEQMQKPSTLIASDERLYGKKLPNSLMTLWKTTFSMLANSYPEALALLDTLAYLAPEAIPPKLLDKLDNSSARKVLEHYALIQTTPRSSTIHRLLQLVVRTQHQGDKPQNTLEKVMGALSETYVITHPTVQDLHVNRQLLTHGESVLASHEALPPETTLRLKCLLANTCWWLGNLQGELGNLLNKKDLYLRALAVAETAYGVEDFNIARFLNSMGNAWIGLGQERQAIPYYERSLAIFEKTLGKEHPNVASTLNNLGAAWTKLGDARQAIDYFARALAIDEITFGNEHLNIARGLTNLGLAYANLGLGEVRQAIGYLERALVILQKNFGNEHPNIAMCLNNLGYAWHKLGEVSQAITYYERALFIHERAYGKEHPEVAKALYNLGFAWYDMDDKPKAIDYLKRSLVIDEKTFGKEHRNVVEVLNKLGTAYMDLGEMRQVIACYERILA